MQFVRRPCVSVLFLAVFAVSLVAAPAVAQSTGQGERCPDVADFVRRLMEQSDNDADGRISREEAGPRFRLVFDRADCDGDGFLDAEELTRAFERPRRQLDARRRPIVANRVADKLAPTHADLAYGTHPRNVLDFWNAESDSPTPLAIFIHGGGFFTGSKEMISEGILRELLDSGISVAAVNYRFVTQSPLPAAHHDCRRALQFVRANADWLKIDKTRVGAFGGSAGAQIAMYLAFHDEAAEPHSDDPIERESTRLTCVATHGAQTTLDLAWWREHVPGHETPHRDPAQVFGTDAMDECLAVANSLSALTLVSADDPPLFMVYTMRPDSSVPRNPAQATQWRFHHVVFGVKLKEGMDALGVEASLKYPGARAKYSSISEFLVAKLKPSGG